LCDCDATVLLNVYVYLMFLGNGWLAVVPSNLPRLRRLCLEHCFYVCNKYVDELLAAAPEVKIKRCRCCFWGADGIIRQWALPDQSESCHWNY